jgi:hypothetical protein
MGAVSPSLMTLPGRKSSAFPCHGSVREADRATHCDSDAARDPSDRELSRADVVPMHRTQRVRPSGTSVGRPRRAWRRRSTRARYFTNAGVVCLAHAGVAASLSASVAPTAVPWCLHGRGRRGPTARNTSRESAAARGYGPAVRLGEAPCPRDALSSILHAPCPSNHLDAPHLRCWGSHSRTGPALVVATSTARTRLCGRSARAPAQALLTASEMDDDHFMSGPAALELLCEVAADAAADRPPRSRFARAPTFTGCPGSQVCPDPSRLRSRRPNPVPRSKSSRRRRRTNLHRCAR